MRARGRPRRRSRWTRRRPRQPCRSAPCRRPHQLQLADAEVFGPEAGLAVGEVELPHATEGLIESAGVELRPLLVEPRPPQVQGAGVVGAELAVLEDAQAGVPGECLLDRLQ